MYLPSSEATALKKYERVLADRSSPFDTPPPVIVDREPVILPEHRPGIFYGACFADALVRQYDRMEGLVLSVGGFESAIEWCHEKLKRSAHASEMRAMYFDVAEGCEERLSWAHVMLMDFHFLLTVRLVMETSRSCGGCTFGANRTHAGHHFDWPFIEEWHDDVRAVLHPNGNLVIGPVGMIFSALSSVNVRSGRFCAMNNLGYGVGFALNENAPSIVHDAFFLLADTETDLPRALRDSEFDIAVQYCVRDSETLACVSQNGSGRSVLTFANEDEGGVLVRANRPLERAWDDIRTNDSCNRSADRYGVLRAQLDREGGTTEFVRIFQERLGDDLGPRLDEAGTFDRTVFTVVATDTYCLWKKGGKDTSSHVWFGCRFQDLLTPLNDRKPSSQKRRPS